MLIAEIILYNIKIIMIIFIVYTYLPNLFIYVQLKIKNNGIH
jgi:hypothetical protein